MRRIVVEPPTSDARRERVERKVFDQLAAVRALDRSDAVLLPEQPRPSRARWMFAGAAVAVAAAVAVVLFATRGSGSAPVDAEAQATPSRVVTPPGGTSRFTVGDEAVVDAGNDTSVEVQRAGGGITLVLARGSVDCDVAPRAGRAPFRVVAGELSVEVVGTRFTVTRTPSLRVDVARGKVKVTAPGGTWLVPAGESWTPQQISSTEPSPSPSPSPKASPSPSPVESSTSASTSTTAEKPKRPRIQDHIPLFDRIEANVTADPAAAVREADEFLRRFPRADTVEEVTFLRIQALRNGKRVTEARRAAEDYLKQFPHGTYVDLVTSFAAGK
ncbi:MAG: FecR domain-containing protein [Acidobacteriota bacterium]